MIRIVDLVENIPSGKKIQYIGRSFYNALRKYFEKYGVHNDVDINELVAIKFNELIQSDSFLKDLILFAPEVLRQVVPNKHIDKKSYKNIRRTLINYYGIDYEEKVIEDFFISEKSEAEITLHDFQERVRRKVINLIFNEQKRFLIHMPTGAGKTRTAAEIMIDFIRLSSTRALFNEKIKILWIAQSKELCYQAYHTVSWLINKKGTSNIFFGHFYDNYDLPEDIEEKPAIIFCSIQKLLLNYNKPIWKKIKNENYLVVVDEAHRSIASKWVKALNFFVSNSSTYLMGLTATPGYGANNDERTFLLSTYYQSNRISISDENYTTIDKPIQYLVKREFLAHIKRIDIDSDVEIEESIHIDEYSNFKFSSNTLKQLSENENRNSSIINIITENHRLGKKILVFTCGLEHNEILKVILKEYGIKSETIDANSKNRNSTIEAFKNGDLNVLLNFGVLTTGFDAPKTDVCIIARPISSIVMYSQMVGRILRGPKNNGNKENSLYTIKDNLNHGDYDKLFNSFNDFYN